MKEGTPVFDSHCHLPAVIGHEEMRVSHPFKAAIETNKWDKFYGPWFGGCITVMCHPNDWSEQVRGVLISKHLIEKERFEGGKSG